MLERSLCKSLGQTQDMECVPGMALTHLPCKWRPWCPIMWMTNTSPKKLCKNIKKVHEQFKSKGFKMCIYMQTSCHSWWSWIYLVKQSLLVLVTSSEMIQITRHNSISSEVIGTFILQLEYKVLPTESGWQGSFQFVWWQMMYFLLQNVAQKNHNIFHQW